ncbi:amidohydrolase family protein [Pseudomonas syringae pv. dysoxyli]|uniref:amidohydrolase family protein n=1 Tax=Pseudomonas syringae TaxID=317 RepID=UPI001372E26F|nr:amidohydrolase family protein [Pseudomonas syringae]NAO28811.1 amidohydrolase family protein [Pseudomonas syringae pv. dysoxyli]
MSRTLDRRTFVKHTAITVAALCASSVIPAVGAEQGATPVPNDAISARPALKAPAHACDTHIHIMDARFPGIAPGAVAAAGMDMGSYRQLQKQLGTERVVIVQPKLYGTRNDCILDAIAQFGAAARGIAVVDTAVTDAELERLNAGGIRGIRFSVWNAKDAVVSIDMLAPLAERIKDLGWHVQLHMSGDQIVQHTTLLNSLQVPMVFDHMGRLPVEQGIKHPAFAVMANLVQADKAWVKLAGAYLNTLTGSPYADAGNVARALVELAPERLVWGSDWPHTTEPHKPDSGELFDLLGNWAPTPQLRERVLVDNPARLYGFK